MPTRWQLPTLHTCMQSDVYSANPRATANFAKIFWSSELIKIIKFWRPPPAAAAQVNAVSEYSARSVAILRLKLKEILHTYAYPWAGRPRLSGGPCGIIGGYANAKLQP